jgi:hypothetical protein
MSMLRVSHRNPLHEFAEWAIRDLHQCMQMIGHPAERVNSCVVREERFCDESCQPISIRRAAEQRLSVIASQDDVIAAAWNV